jgi:hypothetical protein
LNDYGTAQMPVARPPLARPRITHHPHHAQLAPRHRRRHASPRPAVPVLQTLARRDAPGSRPGQKTAGTSEAPSRASPGSGSLSPLDPGPGPGLDSESPVQVGPAATVTPGPAMLPVRSQFHFKFLQLPVQVYLHAHWHLVTAQRSWILTGRLLECQHGVSLPNPTQLTFQPRWTQEAPEGSRFESDGGQPMLRMLGGRPHGVPSAMTPTLPCAPTDTGALLTAA